MRPAPLALLLVPLAACAPLPAIDVARFENRLPPADADVPALLPVEAVLAAGPSRADRGAERAAEEGAAVEARAAALRARAEALSGPVIPPAERGRLEDARTPPPGS